VREPSRNGSPPSPERALVTGGLGFVGSHLCAQLLRDGTEVAVLDDLSLGAPENLREHAPAVTLFRADVRDAEAVRRSVAEFSPTAVFHLAAVHYIPACEADPVRAIEVNVAGTEAVLQACLAAPGLHALVLASTGAVYAPSAAAHGEDSPLGPTDVYGHTKLWAEQLVALFHARRGVPTAVARLFNVFGPSETNPHLIPTVIRQAERAAELALGDLSTRRDYVFAEDVAGALAAMARACARDGGARTCNVGSERAAPGTEVVRLVGELMGRELTVRRDATRLRPSDRPLLLSDCALARASLDWSAGTSLADGLRQAVDRPLAAGVEVG